MAERGGGLSTSGSYGLPHDSEEARSFYQHRLAQYFRLMFLLSLTFFGLGNGIALAFYPFFKLEMILAGPATAWHGAAAGLSAVLWLVARHGTLSPRQLDALDVGGAISTYAAYTMMGIASQHAPHERFDLVLTLISVILQMTRAVMVPSTAGRTVLVGLGFSAPLLYASFVLAQEHELARGMFVTMAVVYVGLWCLITIIPAALASRVIYGLRKQVREALQLGQYTLEERIGEGGMGIVYRARHAMLRRSTAIKLLPPDRAGRAALTRFEREVQLTSRLTHPNTVAIYDYGRTADGVFYYAMELLDGLDLARLVELDGPQPPARVVHILTQVMGALAEAHDVGLVHRDIKPANIILCERGGVRDVAKVVDFGLVKELGAHGLDPGVSTAHALVGTPHFMAPEAVRAPDRVDARSDLYACGAVAYYLLTGQPVFEGETVVDVCSQHLHATPMRPSERLGRELPSELEALVLACLAKDPTRRPESARSLRDALRSAGIEAWREEDAHAAWARIDGQKQALQETARTEPAHSPPLLTVDLRRRTPERTE